MEFCNAVNADRLCTIIGFQSLQLYFFSKRMQSTTNSIMQYILKTLNVSGNHYYNNIDVYQKLKVLFLSKQTLRDLTSWSVIK